jgi:transposase-like protein
MDFTDKKAVKGFLHDNGIDNLIELKLVFKNMAGSLLDELLEGERDDHLGYSKHDYANKKTDNSRNGYSSKNVKSNYGELELSIPRDRQGEFEPQLVKKYQTDITGIEDNIISMYAKGMTVRDIQSHIEEIYGGEISAQTISNITDRVLPHVEEWRNRQLKEVYAITYIDGIRYKVRSNGTVKDKTVYGVIGIDLEGNKEVLGLWIAETESAKYWLSVLTEIRNRGVKDILIMTSDDLPGIRDAISAVYPDVAYQGCVVHVIRNSMKYVSWKDMKAFSRDMKFIYKASTEESALQALDELRQKWGTTYALAVNTWERNWERIRTMFRFTDEVRTLIYTTNPMESFNRQLRKVTKNRSLFPDDTSALKLLYLATQEVLKKWTVKTRDWSKILAQLSIHFDERLTKYL